MRKKLALAAALCLTPAIFAGPILGTIVDGTSNTLILGETPPSTGGSIVDGTSNTILIGEQQARPAVPEPGTLALMGLGLAGLAWAGRRRT